MSVWGQAKGILAQVAPVLGTAIGGPFGGLAARAITQALLGEASDDEALAAQAVRNASPEQLLALRKADHDFTRAMGELDVRFEELSAADRRDARARQVATRDAMPALIALAALTGFFGILLAMIFVELPARAEQPLAVMLGGLGTLVTQIGAYYFGSSAGSRRKNEVISHILESRDMAGHAAVASAVPVPRARPGA